MYDENSFGRHILFLKIKHAFLLIFFSIIGCIIGIILSTYLIGLVMLSENIRLPIITISTLIFFLWALISTSKIKKEIKDEYWKFEVIKNLTSISTNRLRQIDSLETYSCQFPV